MANALRPTPYAQLISGALQMGFPEKLANKNRASNGIPFKPSKQRVLEVVGFTWLTHRANERSVEFTVDQFNIIFRR